MDIEHNNMDRKEIKTNCTVVQTISKCFASVALLNGKAIECVRSCDQKPYLYNETKRRNLPWPL